MLVAAIIIELFLLPAHTWYAEMRGVNSIVCLTYITQFGIGPLAIFLVALRHGAPTRPATAGAVSGLLAGGLAATLYATHGADDSPLFVAVWYILPIIGLASVGAGTAYWFARW